ncbi:MAG: hypothetical protein JNL32_09285 [Candidatus Kapabacteria bacterium]|nr:hypothetical protein [Candidatus Kapabacteria bacterium]
MKTQLRTILATALVWTTFTSGCKETVTEPPVVIDTVSCDSIPAGKAGSTLRIVWLDANPTGDDNFSEKVTLMNFAKGGERVNASGYYILNSWDRRFDLPGRWIDPCAMSEFVIDEIEMFDNEGDTLRLFASSGDILIQTVPYSAIPDGRKLRIR